MGLSKTMWLKSSGQLPKVLKQAIASLHSASSGSPSPTFQRSSTRLHSLCSASCRHQRLRLQLHLPPACLAVRRRRSRTRIVRRQSQARTVVRQTQWWDQLCAWLCLPSFALAHERQNCHIKDGARCKVRGAFRGVEITKTIQDIRTRGWQNYARRWQRMERNIYCIYKYGAKSWFLCEMSVKK